MGMGDEPMGALPMGDPAALLASTPAAHRPAAILMNVATRDFDRDANGRYIPIHPVDAAVLTIMVMLEKRIPASPTTGTTLDQVRSPYDPRAPSDVRARVRLALKALVDRGDITIDQILFEPRTSGIAVELQYVNNRLLPRKVQSAFASLAG